MYPAGHLETRRPIESLNQQNEKAFVAFPTKKNYTIETKGGKKNCGEPNLGAGLPPGAGRPKRAPGAGLHSKI